MNEFRERKLQERAQRIARRIVDAGGVKNMNFPSLDAVAAPGTGGWKVPEPSADILAHMESFGFREAESERCAAVSSAIAVEGRRLDPPRNEDR